MAMTVDEYRIKIRYLDEKIKNTQDVDKKLTLIDENLKLNREYINLLRKPIAAMTVWCVILSVLFFCLGLMIFLPPINIRKGRIRICERRIAYLTQLKMDLENW